MINKAKLMIIMLIIAFSWNFYTVESFSCPELLSKSNTRRFDCPRPGEPWSKMHCCGTTNNEYCCDDPFNRSPVNTRISSETSRVIHRSNSVTYTSNEIGGIISSVITLAIMVGIFICFKHPSCIIYQRRHVVAVYQTYTAMAVQPLQQQQTYPAQSGGHTAVTPYPTQAQLYPQEQPYPPQQPNPAGFYPPPHMGAGQPPPYAENQKTFNPGYVNPGCV